MEKILSLDTLEQRNRNHKKSLNCACLYFSLRFVKRSEAKGGVFALLTNVAPTTQRSQLDVGGLTGPAFHGLVVLESPQHKGRVLVFAGLRQRPFNSIPDFDFIQVPGVLEVDGPFVDALEEVMKIPFLKLSLVELQKLLEDGRLGEVLGQLLFLFVQKKMLDGVMYQHFLPLFLQHLLALRVLLWLGLR